MAGLMFNLTSMKAKERERERERERLHRRKSWWNNRGHFL